MRFACLVYIDETAAAQLGADGHVKLKDDCIDFDWSLRDSGRLLLAQPLQPPQAAVTLRSRDGRTTRTDGPFAETKEFLGGFFLIEARDLDEAVAIVEADPIFRIASVEIRPFLDQTHSVTGRGRPEPASPGAR